MKRLIDLGHRPGRIVGRPVAELAALIEPGGEPAGVPGHPELTPLIELVRAHRVVELRQGLGQLLMRQGLARFLAETVAPLTQAVGDHWMRRTLEVFEEHLYSETLQGLLRGAIAALPQSGRPPRVLLTTFPNEQHGLGLLMAEGMLALEGATCVPLGTQTPLSDIVRAATGELADIVGLSFSASYPVNQAREGLEELRARLPGEVEIWAGGSNPGLARRPVPGVSVLSDLAAIPAAVARWREMRGERLAATPPDAR